MSWDGVGKGLLWQLLYWIIFIHPAKEGMSDHGTWQDFQKLIGSTPKCSNAFSQLSSAMSYTTYVLRSKHWGQNWTTADCLEILEQSES